MGIIGYFCFNAWKAFESGCLLLQMVVNRHQEYYVESIKYSNYSFHYLESYHFIVISGWASIALDFRITCYFDDLLQLGIIIAYFWNS